jgi:multidrug efflux system outer membrane protein
MLLLTLAGCSLAPQYQRPQLPVPDALPAAAAPSEAASAVSTTEWRTTFPDPRMQSLIERALAGNRDLRVAVLNVERAAAMYRIQRSELYPGFGVAAVGQRYRVPEKMSSDGQASTVGEYSVSVGIPTWEIDLFGRIGSLRDAALHQYLATAEVRAATELSVVSATAASYLALAADSESLSLARSTLAANQSSYDLIVQSRDLGVATDLDMNQARSLVESARADVAHLEGNLRVDQNALSLLVGEPVGAEFLPDGLPAVEPIAAIEPGLRSDVLLQRPDILAAEHLLMAANANIGAARAAFFPRVTLTAQAGTLGPEVSSLFGSGTGTWSFVPQILTPIWAGGALRANLAATRASRDIAVAQYEKAIQQAFAEVSDALAERSALSNERSAVEGLVTSLEETHRLATARYEAGIDSYLQVLVVERSLFGARQRLVGLRFAEQANRITLFKVLAGESSRRADKETAD